MQIERCLGIGAGSQDREALCIQEKIGPVLQASVQPESLGGRRRFGLYAVRTAHVVAAIGPYQFESCLHTRNGLEYVGQAFQIEVIGIFVVVGTKIDIRQAAVIIFLPESMPGVVEYDDIVPDPHC